MTAQLVAVLGRGVLSPDEPAVFADDLGFTRGDGCFDSARVVCDADGARVVNLAEHLDRLGHSAAALDLACPSRSEWEALVAQALAAWWEPGEATLKLVLTRGREWAPEQAGAALLTIRARPAATVRQSASGEEITRGLRAVILTSGRPSDAFRDAPWLLGGVKTLSYVVNAAAAREARRRGADDAIFVSTDGYALDGPTSGLVVASGGVLRTAPTGDTGILASVTVQQILASARADGMVAREELVPVPDLFTADGVWLVSSSRGPSPVVELDGRPLAVDPELVARVTRYAGF
ncbi:MULTISPECIES: aminodeoxychorismate lyase [unclassified Luteococcus]|uniref:aminodeoxychorismate lyase n=1 Tax=unclassified Luteococcus TaxID=2639923 RepID=UPI00313E1776